YPENYKECTVVAKKELADDARPELVTKVENMKDYDVIFMGYPIWWSDMPMAVYSFMESYDFSGKTIIPFCTSAGDGLTGKESSIPKYANGATVLQGIGIEGKRAQENPDSVRTEVRQWLTKLGFVK
ncbi:MAG: flavodoxin, partial [Firmicutes bacterium]|nr:flavodoxin [Bacillota bacterium]